MEVESRPEGADARAGATDATDEATAQERPAAAAPVRPEASVDAILEAVRVRGETLTHQRHRGLGLCCLFPPLRGFRLPIPSYPKPYGIS